jgi:aminoglycoside phosphotransferase (APT) family kinase protein
MEIGAPLAVGRTAEVFAWDDGRVLKLFRPGWGKDIATHEAEVARAIYESGAPAPRVDELAEVDGRAGVVYERIAGPSLLGVLSARLSRLPWVARTLAEAHAAIHLRTMAGLPRMRETLARRIQAAPSLPPALQRAALRALATLPDADVLCHGDYHLDNVLLSARGPLIIDWENAALGDPLADVARTLMVIRAGFVYTGSATERAVKRAGGSMLNSLYLRRYRQLRPFDRARLAAWELPVTAARLAAEIEPEEAYLVERVRQLSAQSRE